MGGYRISAESVLEFLGYEYLYCSPPRGTPELSNWKSSAHNIHPPETLVGVVF